MDVLADVSLAGIAHEPRDRHVLAELGDDRRDALHDRALRILQPRVARGVARLLDLGEHVPHQLLEVGRARDEVRFAVDLGEDAGRVIGGDRVGDQPFAGRAARLLRGARQAALAQDRVRLLEVAVRLGERVLALHHARARLIAQLLHHVGRDRRGRHSIAPGDPQKGRPTYQKKRRPRFEAGA